MSNGNFISSMFGGQKEIEVDIFKENPNPKLTRSFFLNLNNEYQFTVNESSLIPHEFKEVIVVPYPINSTLSKITNCILKKKKHYHYHKDFYIDDTYLKDKVILHFLKLSGVYSICINGKELHKGINEINLSFDIKKYLTYGYNSLDLDFIYIKDGMLGITGSVYLEPVSNSYIKDVKIESNLKDETVTFTLDSISTNGTIKILSPDGRDTISQFNNNKFMINLDNIIPWTPSNPYFYQYEIDVDNDTIEGTFILTSSTLKDYKKILCYNLNEEPLAIRGLVDNYYIYPGITTPESYEFLSKTFENIKNNGFNSIYIKNRIESPYFYYLSETKGLLLAQNIVFNNLEKLKTEIDYLSKYGSIYLYIVENNSKEIENRVIYNLIKNRASSSLVVVKDKKETYGDLNIINNIKGLSKLKKKQSKHTIITNLEYKKDFSLNFINFMKNDYIKYSVNGLVGFYYSSLNNPKDGIFTIDLKKRAHSSKDIYNFFMKE